MSEIKELLVRKAAVLGAGVMGAQIAAHLINANVETILFDLPSQEGKPNAIVDAAKKRLTKLKPPPLALNNKVEFLDAANYKTDLDKLKDCDLVIEAIAERLDWKEELYALIAPHLKEDVVLATNTSGLSIAKLAEVLPKKLRSRFCGVHFFNPPRYMHLVELTPCDKTDSELLLKLEAFLVTCLGKGVVHAKDTPNFIANRIGVFSMLATMHHAEQYKIPLEVVDALTGPAIGRAKSATFRTADVVGLDTMGHVVKTMTDNLPKDPWHRYFHLPEWMQKMIQQGALGQKTGSGVYKKNGKAIYVFDLQQQDYRVADQTADESVLAILKNKDPQQRMQQLRESNHPQAQFLWACFRDLFHYTAYHLADIAENVRDIDFAIRWGFAWKQGPFEIWQSANWAAILKAIESDIAANNTMASVELPKWVTCDAVYEKGLAYSPTKNQFVPRSSLPVYKRQIFPDPVITESFDEGHTIFENDALRAWHLAEKIAIVSFKTKLNTISIDVLEGIQEAIKIAEKDYKGLVLWQRHGDHFSAGANLSAAVGALQAGRDNEVLALVEKFQQTSLMLRYCQIPTIAAVKGYVFGGGCELMMHCDRTVATLESYIGLVEAGVGLLPAGGGCKEFALRASQAANLYHKEPFEFLQHYFKQIAMAEVCNSSLEAKQKLFLREADCIEFNTHEILHVAIQQAIAMYEAGYRAPLHPKITACGKGGIATLQMMLVNYREGNFISDHDFEIGLDIAKVLCGDEIETGSIVDETWLLRLEREFFLKLAKTEKTQQRITHTLKTGKPLRN